MLPASAHHPVEKLRLSASAHYRRELLMLPNSAHQRERAVNKACFLPPPRREQWMLPASTYHLLHVFVQQQVIRAVFDGTVHHW
jgi:hypothetical protein